MKLSSRLGVTAAMIAATISASVVPAAATHTGPGIYHDGRGAFTAASAPTFLPPPLTGTGGTSTNPCSIYTGYHANLVFPDGSVADIRSNPGVTWGEGPEGTYAGSGVSNCANSASAVVPGFAGTFVDRTAGVVCTLTGGTYQRGRGLTNGLFGPDASNPTEMNVRFTFNTTNCNGRTAIQLNAKIPHVALSTATQAALDGVGTMLTGLPGPLGLILGGVYSGFLADSEYVSACAGLIAPPTCLLGPTNSGPVTTV